MQNGGDASGILWLNLVEYPNQFDTVEKLAPGSEFTHKAAFEKKNLKKKREIELLRKNEDYEI